MFMGKRNDGKTSVSFRIPLEVEKEFHKYCVNREDRVTKSELLTQLICDFLKKVANESEVHKNDDDIYQ